MTSALSWAILAVVVTGFMGLVTLLRVDFGRLDSKIEGQGAELRAEMSRLGTDLRTEMRELRIELGTRIDLNTARIDAQTARIDAQTVRIDWLTERVEEHLRSRHVA